MVIGTMMSIAVAVGTLMAGSLGTATPALAKKWRVDRAQSTIGFSGTHAGRAFEGRFEDWNAEIVFDPDNLDAAQADVEVMLGSAVTGDVTYDKTLPTADWFNVAVSPKARFTTTHFQRTGDGAFQAEGTLGIRGFTVPVTLDFTFEATGKETARIAGKTRLKRLDFAIGKGSDATGAWVALDIPVTVDVRLIADPAANSAVPTQ